jgi:hypothetical protein
VNAGVSPAQVSTFVLDLIEQVLRRPALAHRRDKISLRRSRVG